jgi:hypothetical protein
LVFDFFGEKCVLDAFELITHNVEQRLLHVIPVTKGRMALPSSTQSNAIIYPQLCLVDAYSIVFEVQTKT